MNDLRALVVALALAALPVRADERPFDWDGYHARQDACLEANRHRRRMRRRSRHQIPRRAFPPGGEARLLSLQPLRERLRAADAPPLATRERRTAS
jgi:hypothetical protein